MDTTNNHTAGSNTLRAGLSNADFEFAPAGAAKKWAAEGLDNFGLMHMDLDDDSDSSRGNTIGYSEETLPVHLGNNRYRGNGWTSEWSP